MKQPKSKTLTIIPLSLLALFFASLFFTAISQASEITIIANNSVGDSSLTKLDLKNIYVGKQTKWSDGSKIELVALKKTDSHKIFTKTYVGKSPSQFRMFWKKIVFTGKGKAPKSFKSEADLLKYVATNDNTIGYITSGGSTDGVKTITISDN